MGYKKLTILVDMDDTIEELLIHWIAYLNQEYGTDVKMDDITGWSVQDAFPDLTAEQVYRPLTEDDFWRSVTPKPDAQQYLHKLMEDGHEIYITTSSTYKTIPAKMEYVLFRYFPWISWDHVVIATKKQMIHGDVMVDDGPHNLEDGCYYKILMDAPHNRRYKPPRNGFFQEKKFVPVLDKLRNHMIRIKNWEEAYNVITNLAHDLYEYDSNTNSF